MPIQYNGIPSNIAGNLAASVNIASSTNATPIVVTTSAPSVGLTNGDVVDVSGHLTNTNANGRWAIAGLSAGGTSFQLAGTAGNGVGGATGTVQSLACGPTYPVPQPGDLAQAVSVDTALYALGDRTAFLTNGTGAWKLAYSASFVNDDDTNSNWASGTNLNPNGTSQWFNAAVSGTSLLMPPYQAGDILVVSAAFSVGSFSAAGGSPTQIKWAIGSNAYTSTFKIPGSGALMLASASFPTPIALSGQVASIPPTVSAASQSLADSSNNRLFVGIRLFGGTPPYTASWALVGDVTIEAELWRSTSVPQ